MTMRYMCLIQVVTNPFGEPVPTQSPVCALVLPFSPVAFSPPPPPPPADVIIDVPLVDENLQAAISAQSSVPIAGFQFDVVDNGFNPVTIDSE